MEQEFIAQMAAMKLAMDQQAQQIRELAAQNAALMSTVSSATNIPTAPKKPKLSPPSKFKGDKKTARQFMAQCKLYFEALATDFPSPRSQIIFVITLLEDAAAQWALPFVERNDAILDDLEKFTEAFYLMFGEQNPQRRAQDALRSLRQRDGTVAEYASAFRLQSVESGWNDTALTNQFYWGLSEAVKDQLLRLDEPSSLEDLIRLSLRVDDRLSQRRSQRPYGQFGTAGRGYSTRPPNEGSITGRAPMQLDATRKPLTAMEKADRRAKGLCMYCGVKGHFVAQCPAKENRQIRGLGPQDERAGHAEEELNPPIYKYPRNQRHLSITVTIVQEDQRWDTLALVDSGAEGNFMDLTYAARQGMMVRKKAKPERVVSIDGHPVRPGVIDREVICVLQVGADHAEDIRFDLIHSPNNPLVLGHPWLWKNDPQISWKQSTLEFPSTPSQRTEERASNASAEEEQAKGGIIRLDQIKEDQIEENTRQIKGDYTEGDTRPIKEDEAEIEEIEGEVERLLGAIGPIIPDELRAKSEDPREALPLEYADFAEVFSKVEADQLPPHREYDCPIDLVDGKVPPFGPIYPLSEPELQALREYLDENLAKGFIVPSKSPAASPILFQKKKDGSLRLCVDYRKLNEITKKNRYPLPLIPEIIERLRGAKVFTKLDLRGAYNLIRMREGDEWKTAFRTRYGLYEYLVMPFGLTNAPATFQAFMNDIFRDILDVSVIVFLDDIMIFSENPEDHVAHVREVLRRLKEHKLYSKLSKCEFHRSTVEFLGFIITPEGVKMDESKVKSILEWERPTSVKDIQSFLGFANFYRRFIPNFSAVVSPITKLLRKGAKFEWTEETDKAFEHLKSLFVSDQILIHPDQTKPFVVETDASNYALGCVLSQMHTDGRLHPCAFYSRSLNDHERNYDIHDKELLAIKVAFEQWRHLLEGATHEITVLTDHRNLEYFQTKAKILNQRHARWATFLSRFRFVLTYRPGTKNGKSDALSRRSDYRPEGGEMLRNPDTEATILQKANFSPTTTISAASLGIDADNQSDTEAPSSDQSNTEAITLHEMTLSTIGAATSCSFSTDFSGKLQGAMATDPLAVALRQHWAEATNRKIFELLTPQQVSQLWEEGSYILRGKRIYIPSSLRVEVLQSRHDDPAAGHYGVARSTELVTRDYWWPGLQSDVEQFVRSCDTCGRAKAPRHRKFGELQPLPTPEHPWESISMDFITDLPISEGHTAILVVVDRLTKMSHFIPLAQLPTAEQTAESVVRNVFKLHGLPKTIISDRGPQFASKFWQRFMELLGVKVKLSTAFHPETDGQTERVNQTLEQYLRCFVNYQQDNWAALLPLAEFTYNNTLHASTRHSPFFANYGRHPSFDPRIPGEIRVPQAEDRITSIAQALEELKQHLQRAKDTYKYYADKKRQPGPDFQVGDEVWLLSRNVSTARPSKKLDNKRLGPFAIDQKLSEHVYRLDLPPTLGIHPVFHVSLLEPHVRNCFPNRDQPPPPPVIVEGELEYEVNEILDSRVTRGKVYYLVDWKGYGPEDRSWEPEENVEGNVQVQVFHQRYPRKPRPTPERRRTRVLAITEGPGGGPEGGEMS